MKVVFKKSLRTGVFSSPLARRFGRKRGALEKRRTAIRTSGGGTKKSSAQGRSAVGVTDTGFSRTTSPGSSSTKWHSGARAFQKKRHVPPSRVGQAHDGRRHDRVVHEPARLDVGPHPRATPPRRTGATHAHRRSARDEIGARPHPIALLRHGDIERAARDCFGDPISASWAHAIHPLRGVRRRLSRSLPLGQPNHGCYGNRWGSGDGHAGCNDGQWVGDGQWWNGAYVWNECMGHLRTRRPANLGERRMYRGSAHPALDVRSNGPLWQNGLAAISPSRERYGRLSSLVGDESSVHRDQRSRSRDPRRYACLDLRFRNGYRFG